MSVKGQRRDLQPVDEALWVLPRHCSDGRRQVQHRYTLPCPWIEETHLSALAASSKEPMCAIHLEATVPSQ